MSGDLRAIANHCEDIGASAGIALDSLADAVVSVDDMLAGSDTICLEPAEFDELKAQIREARSHLKMIFHHLQDIRTELPPKETAVRQ